MELIPILSTIILVATIATFILAVAAYVLYKIRERRARAGRTTAVPVATVAPAPGHTLVAPTIATPALAAPVVAAPAIAAPAIAAPAIAAPVMAVPAPGLAAPALGAPALAALPAAPAYGAPLGYGSPSAYGDDAYAYSPAFPAGYGAQGLPPVALDTNADGYADTVYAPRPGYADPYAAPTGYAGDDSALPDYGIAGYDTPAGPAVKRFPHADYGAAPAAAPSLFYELTAQGMTPVAPAPGPVFQPYATVGAGATQASLAAEQQHRHAIDAAQGELAQAQRRLQAAEDASRDRSATLRESGSTPGGLAWL